MWRDLLAITAMQPPLLDRPMCSSSHPKSLQARAVVSRVRPGWSPPGLQRLRPSASCHASSPSVTLADEDRCFFMLQALEQARKASSAGEVPIGAVIVRDGRVLAAAHNETGMRNSPLAHAEIICMERAAEAIGAWRLLDCSIYVTTEPCPMCAGDCQWLSVAVLLLCNKRQPTQQAQLMNQCPPL